MANLCHETIIISFHCLHSVKMHFVLASMADLNFTAGSSKIAKRVK